MANTKFSPQTLSGQASIFFQRILDNMSALRENEYGTEFPATVAACQFFVNTTDFWLYQRNISNTEWIQVFNLNTLKVNTAILADTATLATLATTATTATTATGINDYIVTPQKISKYEVDEITAANNYPLYSNTLEKIITETVYTKKYEVFIPFTGSVSVSFSLARGPLATGGSSFARIYVNGTAVGTEQGKIDGNHPSYQTYTEKIIINCGDKIQVYCRSNITTGVYIKDVYIKAKNPFVPAALM